MFFHSLSSHLLPSSRSFTIARTSENHAIMTPKIFATEVKKPVSRLCRLEGEKRKKKEEKKKKKRSECAFPRFHAALPFILLLSPSFYHPPPPISSSLPLLSRLSLPPTPRLHIFPPFSRLDRYRSSLERHCRTSPFLRPFSRVFSKLRSHVPPPHACV